MRLTAGYTLQIFETYLESRAYKEITKKRYSREVRGFFLWLFDQRGKEDLREVTSEDLLSYRKYLWGATTVKGTLYSASVQKGIILTLAHLFRFLARNELVISNPFDRLDLRMQKQYHQRPSIAEEDLLTLLDSIEETDVLGIRDKAILELMYGTGLRVGEVTKLDLTDVDLGKGRVFVREGKGSKDRIVPLGRNTSSQLRGYLSYARPELARSVTDKEEASAFFLTQKGSRVKVSVISYLLKKRFADAGLHTTVSPHMLRHSFATHMLEHGADLKSVKDILGHESMETTAIYTHVNVNNLKKLMKQYHPRENELYEQFRMGED